MTRATPGAFELPTNVRILHFTSSASPPAGAGRKREIEASNTPKLSSCMAEFDWTRISLVPTAGAPILSAGLYSECQGHKQKAALLRAGAVIDHQSLGRRLLNSSLPLQDLYHGRISESRSFLTTAFPAKIRSRRVRSCMYVGVDLPGRNCLRAVTRASVKKKKLSACSPSGVNRAEPSPT